MEVGESLRQCRGHSLHLLSCLGAQGSRRCSVNLHASSQTPPHQQIFLLSSSHTPGIWKLHQSVNTPAPFMILCFGLCCFFRLDFTSLAFIGKLLRPYTDIIFSLKPSWTPLFWVRTARGPHFIISTVSLLPCLAHGV